MGKREGDIIPPNCTMVISVFLSENLPRNFPCQRLTHDALRCIIIT